MITNLVATITICLTTNVTTHFPMRLVPDPVPPNKDGTINAIYLCHQEPVENPTQKDMVTEIYEVENLSFDFNGIHTIEIGKRIVSTKIEHFELHNDWILSTNSLPQPFPFGIHPN